MTLLRGFAISAISSPHNQKPGGKVWFGMEELWQIMQDGSAVSADMRMMAGTVMQDLLGWQHCYPQRGEFLIRCVEQLRAGVSVPQSLRLCTKTVASFPGKQRKKEQSATAVLEWLASQHSLLPSFFVDFRRYHQAATLPNPNPNPNPHPHPHPHPHPQPQPHPHPNPTPNPNQVRVIHMISGFRRRNRAPDFVFKRMRYFDQESASWAAW